MANAMHAALIARADVFEVRTEGSPEEAELKGIADVIEAYEAKRLA